MRISSSVGPAIAAGATEDLILRAPFFEKATFFALVDARPGFTLPSLASGDEAVSIVARISVWTVFVFLATIDPWGRKWERGSRDWQVIFSSALGEMLDFK